MTALRRDGDDLLLECWLQPGAKHTEVVGLHGEVVKIRVAAAPQEGAANQALLSFLADEFCLPKTRLQLERGLSSRRKRIRICRPEHIPGSLAAFIADAGPRL